jgi:hypothetical protein
MHNCCFASNPQPDGLVVVTLQATKLALWMAVKRPLFKETAAPLESRDTENLQSVSRHNVFLFLLAWTSVLTWSRRFWWEIHIYTGLSRRWKKHGGEGTESIVHSLAPDDLRTRNKSNVPTVGWCGSIFIGYYEQEVNELSTGQMLHLPSSQRSLQNPQDKGGPIVTNGAVVPRRWRGCSWY